MCDIMGVKNIGLKSYEDLFKDDKGRKTEEIVPMDIKKLKPYAEHVFDKITFGHYDLPKYLPVGQNDEIELCGLCTDICVVSNALIIKATFPDAHVKVDESCCAGVTPESHENALSAMRMCQIKA